MGTEQASVTFQVLIDEEELREEIIDLISRVMVEDEVSLPDVAVIRFDDPMGLVFDIPGIALGSELEVRVETGNVGVKIFKGEITSLEVDVDNERKLSVVRGYDLSHRMQRGRITETYQDQTIGDVVAKIAKRHGLRAGDTGNLGWVNQSLIQWNESDWGFLSRLAAVYGHEVVVDHQGRLNFRCATRATSGPDEGSRDDLRMRQLVQGENLIRIRAGITAGDLVEQVEVRGWDPKTKSDVVATTRMKRADVHDTTPNLSQIASTFDGGTMVRSDLAFATTEQAKAAAQGIVEQLGAVAAEIEGVTYGDPELRAGEVISVSGVGKMLDGKHTLTSCRHTLSPTAGYTTEFRASGRQRRGLLGLVAGGSTQSSATVNGVVPAIVDNLEDPDNQGRVRVKYPWLDDKSVSPWARVLSVGGGTDRGIVFMPEVNDEVLVAFQQGDTQLPYILGGLHNGRDTQPRSDGLLQGEAVAKRVIQSRKKHRLEFDDTDRDERVLLSVGDDKLQIDMLASETKIMITSEGEIEITSKTNLSIVTDGDLSLEAKGKVEIKGQGVSIDAGGAAFEAKGSTAKVTGQGTLELSAPQSKLAGSGMLELTGGLVKIN